VERNYHKGFWHWAHHEKPRNGAGEVGILASKCVGTIAYYRDRVLVVGDDYNVYERVWIYDSQGKWGWHWRKHGAPPGTTV